MIHVPLRVQLIDQDKLSTNCVRGVANFCPLNPCKSSDQKPPKGTIKQTMTTFANQNFDPSCKMLLHTTRK